MAAGGEYKPGHTDEGQAEMAALEETVRHDFDVREIAYRWTNHDYTSMDKVPFVGKASSDQGHLYVAAGFGAWGLTNGTAAAAVLADTIMGRSNLQAALFDATRFKPVTSASTFAKENVGVARHLVGGYLAARPTSPEKLAAGDAGVFKVDGEHIAAHRDSAGVLHEVSAVCTHLKCIVGWNTVDRTWDCHCTDPASRPTAK